MRSSTTRSTTGEHAASDPADFSAEALATVAIPAGHYRAPTELDLLTVDVVDDTIVEHDETIGLGLQNPSSGVTLAGSAPRTTIEGDASS